MIIHECTQGSEEWFRLRTGIPTASSFDKILTKSGKKSASQERYMYKLLAERMMGHPCFEFMSDFMQRGKELESKAVDYFEMQSGKDTYPIGFVTDDKLWFGASPDRGISEDGLLEVKVPKDETHAMYLLGSGSVLDEYRVQAYGQLWVSGRHYTEVISWHPEMPKAIVHTERDEAFIKLLEEAVLEFSAKLEAKALELAEKGWMPKPANAEPAFSKEVDMAFAAWNEGRSN